MEVLFTQVEEEQGALESLKSGGVFKGEGGRAPVQCSCCALQGPEGPGLSCGFGGAGVIDGLDGSSPHAVVWGGPGRKASRGLEGRGHRGKPFR